ncbi:hypothetical protein EDC61_10675 [Sulfuritortus calidifontis]|uniref:TnsE C-terminal domain-containing protein n=1 Tax=Sulfuritortus calidifontis TaxID=1914471 RepID=A0A4R3JYA8_9PROT|nr:Tn7-like element transposition protein TnsE [Sulfuritortus calidifontis]TCS72160.1 hypothetical protein EDC61_10675 [Sulfuritortus calidifontis]
MSGYKIKEFPQDGAYWRIDWLGKIQPNIDVESEPTIDVLLTKLQTGYTDPLSNGSLTQEHASAAVGIGQLPLLMAGSIWKDGQFHTHVPADRHKLAALEIDTSQELRHVFSDGLAVDGETFDLIPRSHYKVGKHYAKVKDAPIALFPGNGQDLSYFIIPRFELFRFYYACSSKLAFYVWEDAIGHAINQSKSAQLAGNDVRIHLRRDMMDKEAYLLARWFVSDKMRQEVSSFRNKRAMAAANHPKHKLVAIHPDIGFPFNGKTRLRALGKRIMLHESESTGRKIWAFLALHLQYCSHPMPYRNIVVDRDNRNKKGANCDDPGLLPAWADKPNEDSSQSADGDPVATLASDEEPKKELRTKTIDIYAQQFDLQNHRLVKEEVEVQKYQSAKVTRGGDSFVDQYGTGEGTYGESSTGPASASTSPTHMSERYLVTLMPFIEALRWIRTQPGTSVETLALGSEHLSVADETLYLLPEMKRMRSWHRVYSDIPRTRGIMVAKVTTPGQVFYLLEIERRDKAESYSTLVMKSRAVDLPDSHLRAFLRTVARSNGWPRQDHENFHHLKYRGVNHYKEDTAERFGERLMTVAISLS